MQYGFVIDQNTCIGCHACTVACKAENHVPVGNFRTWVKYTEQGSFPDLERNFLVQRCNHCADAPCVTICPVNALEKRPDGIVDIDRDACIGCRACLQACPYDAIYLNEELGAVEKCHFCAHRVEQGLEPACVNVCPTKSIIAGDLHDPNSQAAQLIKQQKTQVRRPEQKTGPNVHYIGANETALHPGRAVRPSTYMSSERPPHKSESWPISLPVIDNATVTLDISHKIEWGWPIAIYLVTKGIAAGAAILSPFVAALGLTGFSASYGPEIIALAMILLTSFLLVEDLSRPMKFYRMLTRPNFNSWLVKGGIIIGLFTFTTGATIVLRMMEIDTAADLLRWVNAAMGLAVAGYTAFLFSQCKGRDLWESNLLLPHLLVQSLMCGSVCVLALNDSGLFLKIVFVVCASVHAIMCWGECVRHHPTENARQAAAFLTTIKLGPFLLFRDSLIIGVGVSIFLIVLFPQAAFIPALVGLLLYEYSFVRAGQLPPLS